MTRTTATTRRSGLMAVGAALGLLSVLAVSPARAAPECTWGTPGYRACVEERIRLRNEAEAAGRKPEPQRTAPANRRPPALTPVDPSDTQIVAPSRGLPPPPSRLRDNQRSFDKGLDGIVRDRDLQPIMPPLRNPIPPMPGQICPSQGC